MESAIKENALGVDGRTESSADGLTALLRAQPLSDVNTVRLIDERPLKEKILDAVFTPLS